MATIKEKNRSLLNKNVDEFYVSFYGIPSNVANILGRQVKSIERPTVTFNTYQVYQKGIKQDNTGTLSFENISIEFLDDENSLTNFSLYRQLMYQTGMLADANGRTGENHDFRINVKCYNSRDMVIEEFTLTGCLIQQLQHSQQIFSDSSTNIITAQINFDNVDYKFPSYVTEGNIDNQGYLIDSTGNRITDSSGNFIQITT